MGINEGATDFDVFLEVADDACVDAWRLGNEVYQLPISLGTVSFDEGPENVSLAPQKMPFSSYSPCAGTNRVLTGLGGIAG